MPRPKSTRGAAGSPSAPAQRYVLALYVAGLRTRSVAAVKAVQRICEEHLHNRYELKVIDLYRHPKLAHNEQIVVAPTLIKKLPLPLRRIIGDMADESRVLVGLGLQRPAKAAESNLHPPTGGVPSRI